MTNILITTRYGLYGYSNQLKQPRQILSNSDFADDRLFPVRGIFGIATLNRTNEIMIGSRPVRRFPWFGKHAHVKKLYIVNPTNGFSIRKEFLLRGIRDIHQIAVHDNIVYIADANMDRVVCFDYVRKKRIGEIYTNPERDGHNHLNTVEVYDETLFIGLNKTRDGSSKIMMLSINDIPADSSFTINAYKSADIHINEGIQDTHDLVPYDGTYLITASGDGYVFRMDTQNKLFEVSDWPRGLLITNEGIWAGCSALAKRSERDRKTDGKLYLFDDNSFEQKNTFTVPKSGQIYDLLRLPVSFLPGSDS